MLRADVVSGNTLRLTPSGELTADDFAKVALQVDAVISRYGKIKVLIDASGFSGWEDLKAFESHVGFIKNHQDKVDRIAAIVAHKWQQWLVGMFRVLLHPEVRAYDKARENEALEWLSEAEKVAAQ